LLEITVHILEHQDLHFLSGLVLVPAYFACVSREVFGTKSNTAQDATIKYKDFLIAVLMKGIEYKKDKKKL